MGNSASSGDPFAKDKSKKPKIDKKLKKRIEGWEKMSPSDLLAAIPSAVLIPHKRQIPLPLSTHPIAGLKTERNCYFTIPFAQEIDTLLKSGLFVAGETYVFLFMENGDLRLFGPKQIDSEVWKSWPRAKEEHDVMGLPQLVYMGPGHTSMLSDDEYEGIKKKSTSSVKFAGHLHVDGKGNFWYIDNNSGHFEPFHENGYMVVIALGLDPLDHFKRAYAVFTDYGQYYAESVYDSVDSQRVITETGYDGYNGYNARAHVYDGEGMRVRAHASVGDYTMVNQNAMGIILGIILLGLICLVSCLCTTISGAVCGYFIGHTLNEPRKRVNNMDAMDEEMVRINNHERDLESVNE